MAENKQPSEEFNRALELSSGGGGCRVLCDFCGRETFNPTGSWDWDEGELEELERRLWKEPDKCISVDYTVPRGYIDGKQCVVGCPCNSVRRYEDWIWSNRRIIAVYLQLRAKKEFDSATEQKKTGDRAKAALDVLDAIGCY